MKIKSIIRQLRVGEMIAISWEDCYTPCSGWMNNEEVNDFRDQLFPVVSCGFYEGFKKDHLCISQSIGAPALIKEDEEFEKKSHLKNIPIGCITTIIPLEKNENKFVKKGKK